MARIRLAHRDYARALATATLDDALDSPGARFFHTIDRDLSPWTESGITLPVFEQALDNGVLYQVIDWFVVVVAAVALVAGLLWLFLSWPC